MTSEQANDIFEQAIADYHVFDSIDHELENPYPISDPKHLFYLKCWIDCVQWHMEDEVRKPSIDPSMGLYWKRRIDQSNQQRTDTVEYIDSYFQQMFSQVVIQKNARINTESPAWAFDRLSILQLKIYHMRLEVIRENAGAAHQQQCQAKLLILLEQQKDLLTSIDELLNDIAQGKKQMKVYRQLKMYNDPMLNPALYSSQ
ncbi:Protein of unknown function [bacterium A37T11]|nr:Protein of unknown function [bacterium A37T11]